MNKSIGYISSIILFTNILFSQSSLIDYFPLSIGNMWSYKYYDRTVDVPGDFTHEYSGIGTYKVTSNSKFNDSTVWKMRCIRNIQHKSYSSDGLPPIITNVIDTAVIDIIEITQGVHKVYIPSNDIAPFIFMYKPLVDSLLFSRYRDGVDSDTLLYNRNYNNLQMSASFKKNSGLVLLSYQNNYPFGHYRTIKDTLISSTILSINEDNVNELNKDFSLDQNYPNPFNPVTTIPFHLKKETNVAIRIYDNLGRLIENVYENKINEGKHLIVWNASRYSSGTYYFVLQTPENTKAMKLVLIK